MDIEKIEWIKGEHNILIVTLPDGSKINAMQLSKKIDIKKQSALVRLNEYILDGHYVDLLRAYRVKKEAPRLSKQLRATTKEQYQEGDTKQIFCPWFKLAMQNI